MSATVLMFVYTVLLGAGAAGCITFVTLYTWRSPWWRSEMGRHVVAFTAALGFLEGVYFARFAVGDWPWRHELLALGLALVVLATWWRVLLFERVWRESRKRSEASQ